MQALHRRAFGDAFDAAFSDAPADGTTTVVPHLAGRSAAAPGLSPVPAHARTAPSSTRNESLPPPPSPSGQPTAVNVNSPRTLDLHGLSAGAATQAVIWWLELQAEMLERQSAAIRQIHRSFTGEPSSRRQRPVTGAEPSSHRNSSADDHTVADASQLREARDRMRDQMPTATAPGARAAPEAAVDEARGALEAAVDEAHGAPEAAVDTSGETFRLIVGRGNHHAAAPWKLAARDPARRSLGGSIRTMLTDANAPIVPSADDNEGVRGCAPGGRVGMWPGVRMGVSAAAGTAWPQHVHVSCGMCMPMRMCMPLQARHGHGYANGRV